MFYLNPEKNDKPRASFCRKFLNVHFREWRSLENANRPFSFTRHAAVDNGRHAQSCQLGLLEAKSQKFGFSTLPTRHSVTKSLVRTKTSCGRNCKCFPTLKRRSCIFCPILKQRKKFGSHLTSWGRWFGLYLFFDLATLCTHCTE